MPRKRGLRMDTLNYTDIPARDAHFHNNWRRTMEPMDRGTRVTGLMQGKRGLIMGVANDHSIAWGIAKTLASTARNSPSPIRARPSASA